MKKLLKKLAILFVGCAIIIFVLNYLFMNYNGIYAYRMINEMYECKQNIDVLFLGSSHAYRSYDPKIADEILGEKTFNAGSSSQLLDQSYYLLKEAAKTNRLKRVYLDTYFSVAQAESSANQWSVYLTSDYMRNSIDKFEYLYNSGGVRTLLDGYVTVRRNTDNINIIKNLKSRCVPLTDYTSVTFDNEEYRGEGFVYSFEVVNESDLVFMSSSDLTSPFPMSAFSYEYLIKIIDFCKGKNIELVLVDQPMPIQLLNNVKGYGNYVDYIYTIAEKYDIQYLNFNCYKSDTGLTLKNYKDKDHLNGSGAEIYTRLFANVVNAIDNGEKEVEDLFYREYCFE